MRKDVWSFLIYSNRIPDRERCGEFANEADLLNALEQARMADQEADFRICHCVYVTVKAKGGAS